jgi:uncharacterized membrane protein YeaQ/YmgE (transglycosylase-associated protein family)
MPLLILIILAVVLVGLSVLVWATFSVLGLIITLLIAGVVGWTADKIVPGELPFGWLGAIAAGLLGAWLGGMLLGDLGPGIAGIAIIPALLGAIIIAFVADWIAKLAAGRRAA